MINIKADTLIFRPVKRVFDFMTTPENDFQWQYGTLASTQVSEGMDKLGGIFRSEGHLMGLRVQNTYEVIEYVLNKSYGFKSLTGPLQSFTTYAFNINKGYTLVELSLQANAVSLLGVNENILKKKMRKQIKENLALLKSILESE